MLSGVIQKGESKIKEHFFGGNDTQKRDYSDGCVELQKGDNESGGNPKESTGKEVEMVWACDEKRGALRRKEGEMQGRRKRGRRRRGWLNSVRDDIKENGQTVQLDYMDVYIVKHRPPIKERIR